MKKVFTKFLGSSKKEITSHKLIYIILVIILLTSFFVRVYRTTDLMGFYYDQGRDALVVWHFWHQGDIFLVGPVTGLAGIFLGPLYYLFVSPFYLIGGGNPAYPAIFLSFLSTLGIFFLYLLGWKMQNRTTGVIVSTVAGFSYYLVIAGSGGG